MNYLEKTGNYLTKSDYPDLGCRHNFLEGIGQFLSLPASYSVSILKNTDSLSDKTY